jgi:hypothetical protein
VKFSIPITCDDCAEFLVDVNGTQLPKDAQCPECSKTIWLVEPLGNIVGMAIMHRAATELAGGDSTLTIVLAAMAVESQLAYLFMKWNRVDLTLQRNPTDADEEEWEERWRDIRSVAARFDKVFKPAYRKVLRFISVGEWRPSKARANTISVFR